MPGELQTEDVRHRRAAAEAGELAERLEREASLRRATELGDDVARESCSLADRVLGRRRARLARRDVGHQRTVTQRPHAGIIGHFEAIVHHDPATLDLQGQRGEDRVRRRGNGADERLGGNAVATAEQRSFRRRARQARVEAELDTALLQKLLRERREALRQLGQDEVTRVQQDDLDLVAVDVPEAARALADEVVHLGDGLDAGESTARHHEREERAPDLEIALDVRLFQHVDDVVAQHQRVAEVLEGQRVLGEAGLAREARHVAERDDEVVVLERQRPRPEAGAHGDDLVLEVDRLHRACVEVRARAEPADRRNDVEDPDAPGDDLGEHGLEHEVVVLVDERDLDVRVVLQELLEGDGGVDAAEASPEDQNARPTVACHRLRAGIDPAKLF